MLTANFSIGSIPVAKPDPGGSLNLNSPGDSFFNSPGRCLFGDDTMELTYPEPPSGFQDQFDGGGSTDLFSLHPAFPPMPDSNPSTARVSNTSPQLVSEAPASPLSSETPLKPDTQPPRQAKTKKKSSKQAYELDNEKPNTASKTRRQSKRESGRSTRNDEAKNPTRRERSLERNRVAASKCRKRKKAWTEKLEEKKSGLEAMHSELQSQYLSLLQESSHLKNHLITHAGCHDPNIDVWINNEASKYVRRLSGENFHRPRRNSHCTGLSESSPAMEGDDSNEEDVVKGTFNDDFSEEMFG
ncbi:hypothetical protein E4U43_005430 [Claviceps pusilla]|uniref:BZIP domain-containing protein n=1 Tax=Claviceps pusilla TaxID=123648 RepID=A0A9P7T012_9HYPO|nr:hypothetical protein E4U43_005430 [Claviceps pusilla]